MPQVEFLVWILVRVGRSCSALSMPVADLESEFSWAQKIIKTVQAKGMKHALLE